MRNRSLMAAAIAALAIVSMSAPTVAGGFKWWPKIEFTQNPAVKVRAPSGGGTGGMTYFGVCKNLAGVQQAGNADANGFCETFGSIIETVPDAGIPDVGASCTKTVTKKVRVWSETSRGNGSWTTVTETETTPGDCPAKHGGWGGGPRMEGNIN